MTHHTMELHLAPLKVRESLPAVLADCLYDIWKGKYLNGSTMEDRSDDPSHHGATSHSTKGEREFAGCTY